ncbi:high affinity immunoglobulin epsilon receptor subunit alpha-like isoform X2 [Archocentrus centrarchus]|uniref:high affinity immunoglobulin epsilon receptor subunit alpha-like isoform X2 n=1 Tax=Archocentrus centrarchus TaxID=63155 RepID=UPI0011EA177A|nr:high affinity immunoglobulin epsilon receptor subunit alpha-like isoform X2 [Archocentrus centrarchus]
MDKLLSLLVFSTLSQLVVPDVPNETSLRANIEMVSEHSSIFSGERARLRCSVTDQYRTTWSYLWFRGSEELSQTGEELSLWNAKIQDSGKYYCQGIRATKIGKMHTIQSLPVEISVNGGWAILQVPQRPVLVGDTLKMTCRVRGNPPLQEVILYKDGVEVMRQNGLKPDIYMTNVRLEDQGMYSCRASWDVRRLTHSVISGGAHVQILEVLSQPVLEISPSSDIMLNRMKLTCHVQYNAPAPAPPINYYFYRNNKRLGPATSNNYDLVIQTPGLYSCKARVPELVLSKWSEPKPFGRIRVEQPLRPHHL